MSSPVSEQLQRQLARCRSPRRHSAITTRWGQQHAALEGLSIDEIIDCCARCTTEQNPIVGALVALHQAGDTDASTVLMTVCKPVIFKLAHMFHEHGLSCEHIDTMWAALGHALALIDPTDVVIDDDGNPKVFIAIIGSWVADCKRQLSAADRRHHRDGRHLRMVELSAMTAANQNHPTRMWDDPHSNIENTVISRLELAQIADAVRRGDVDADKWQRLLQHRVTDTGASTSPSDRVAIHRTGRRLARLVDHAAA